MVKQNSDKLLNKQMQRSIEATLLHQSGSRKKQGSKDGLIDDYSARLCLLGVLKHPKHNVRAVHRQLDE